MSTRLSRRAAVAVGLSIVAIMLVWAPMGALADSGNGNAPATPPGNSADAPGQADGTAPGNSENAPGQATDTGSTAVASDPAPGNSGTAPGQTKTDSGPPETSNAGGNSADAGGATTTAGGGNPNAGGGNPNAGGANSNGGGSNPNSGDSGSDNGDPAHEGDCDQNDDGVGGPYDADCDGTHQNPGPGNSDNSPGKPADGTVGKADNKNPKGQQPGGNDHNKGYECEPGKSNKGIGKGNPAHTGCIPPPCPNGYSLTVNVTNTNGGTGTVSHSTGTFTTAVTTVTATGTGGSTANPASQTVAYTNCAGTANVEFTKSQNCPNGFSLSVVVTNTNGGTGNVSHASGTYTTAVTTVTATGTNGSSASPASQTVAYTDCAGTANVNFSKSGGDPCPPGTDHAGEFVTPCDDSDVPCPPGTDHAGEFVSPCDEDDVLGTTLCPDGTVMPASGECEESVLPDFVLGIRLNQDPAGPEVLPNTLNAAPEGVAGAVLPFTGGNLLPFLMVSLATLSIGGASLARRKK